MNFETHNFDHESITTISLAPPRGRLLGGLGGCGRRDGLWALDNSIRGVQVGGWGWQEQIVALISAKTGDMWIFGK